MYLGKSPSDDYSLGMDCFYPIHAYKYKVCFIILLYFAKMFFLFSLVTINIYKSYAYWTVHHLDI